MAGNIQGVNLQQLKSEIDDYEGIATKMYDCLKDVGSYMKSLRNYWTGGTINSVINTWNTNRDSINEGAFYFARNIPLILKDIYNQYRDMERGEPNNSHEGYSWWVIPKIELTDESNIKFYKPKVDDFVDKISTEINEAIGCLKRLVNSLDSMQAYSDSLKILYTTYQNTAKSVESSLTNLCNNLVSELNDAVNDVAVTEGYNEEDAKSAGSTSRGGYPNSGSTGGSSAPQGGSSGSGSAGESPDPQGGSSGSGSVGGSPAPQGGSSGSGSVGESPAPQGGSSGSGSVGGSPAPQGGSMGPGPVDGSSTPQGGSSGSGSVGGSPAPQGGSMGPGPVDGSSTPQGGSSGSGSVNSEDPYSTWDHIIPPDGSPWYPGWTGTPKS